MTPAGVVTTVLYKTKVQATLEIKAEVFVAAKI